MYDIIFHYDKIVKNVNKDTIIDWLILSGDLAELLKRFEKFANEINVDCKNLIEVVEVKDK